MYLLNVWSALDEGIEPMTRRILLLVVAVCALTLGAGAPSQLIAKDKAGRLSQSFVVRETDEVRSSESIGPETRFEDVPDLTATFTLDHTATVVVQGNLTAYQYNDVIDCDFAVAIDGEPLEPAIRARLAGFTFVPYVDAATLGPGQHRVSVEWRAVSSRDPVPSGSYARAAARRMIVLVY